MTDDDYIAADTAEMSASEETTGLSLEGSAADGLMAGALFSSPVLDSIRTCD